ncbi:hypothetical protein BACCAP_04435 [Pseudoflavonifractor capillosus ATCC 29799]|uniref:Uncharacterized protein n=1 Tax=Pseudoflavonifractor capillosus ATCC 29799 TaxID=411467 RepID=A6P1R3_9FIRM|nr:hypothetical protein BACCAP_04435 [Pseudoflavonifractor capillosus ATCC 29799]
MNYISNFAIVNTWRSFFVPCTRANKAPYVFWCKHTAL